MTWQTLMFFVLVFSVSAGIAGLVAWIAAPDRLQRRLARLGADDLPAAAQRETRSEKLAKLLRPLARPALPAEGWDRSALRLRFINAGLRGRAAPTIFFATKTGLAMLLPLVVLLLSGESLLAAGGTRISVVLVLLAAIGYYLPNAVLNHMVEKRKLEIFENFPDTLDLMIICVEAGLSLDQAIAKVAVEIEVKSKVLAKELQLVMTELRSGFAREAALRHLALRTGVEDIDLLVAMLVQADRFGTSMGDSLRVHADNLRTKRRQRAEEAAAKIAVKLLIPLIFLIFPTLMMVLLGPAAIQIFRVLLPTLAGQG